MCSHGVLSFECTYWLPGRTMYGIFIVILFIHCCQRSQLDSYNTLISPSRGQQESRIFD